ncbi:histidine phosphatase family protein [Aquibacillus koreensis]|uniref:Histidine phosphatase family protein n=1 Tax=Aquibacillus koreensis TaxID=279446 RepID=A0A9X3WP31_9BACI|nr:histidine phosphatase family protein [Aquibacillus koreensis]MCT2537692.1 histidine phosphatase family protein [Aquibacillus koreensis]MDC3420961.1 histidine phosphatase family protein [Aquibacillus koreensis]
MITNLYLVRHAHSTYTPEELTRPLSDQGFRDVDKVTALLEDKSIEHVLSSPYLRAFQTVEGIATLLDTEIKLVEDLKERTLSRTAVDDFPYAIEKVWTNPNFSWEGGESNLSAQQRGIKAIQKIIKDYHGKNVAIGTHGNIMVLIMNYFDKQYGFAFWKQLEMPAIYQLSFDGEHYMHTTRILD